MDYLYNKAHELLQHDSLKLGKPERHQEGRMISVRITRFDGKRISVWFREDYAPVAVKVETIDTTKQEDFTKQSFFFDSFDTLAKAINNAIQFCDAN